MNFESFYVAVAAYTQQKIKCSIKACAKEGADWCDFLESEGYYVKNIYYDHEYTYIHLICDVEAGELKGTSAGFTAFVWVEITADDFNAENPDIIIGSSGFYIDPHEFRDTDGLYKEWLSGCNSQNALFDESLSLEEFCKINGIEEYLYQ